MTPPNAAVQRPRDAVSRAPQARMCRPITVRCNCSLDDDATTADRFTLFDLCLQLIATASRVARPREVIVAPAVFAPYGLPLKTAHEPDSTRPRVGLAVLAIDPFVDSASSTRVHAEQCHNTLLIVQEFSFVLRLIAVHAFYVIHVHEQR